MEVTPSNSVANAAQTSPAATKASAVEETKLSQVSTRDTVTLSAEATAAADEESETPTPQHGGGGVVVPPVKD